MSGSVAGTARAGTRMRRGIASAARLSPTAAARALEREPFVLLVVALDAVIVSVLLPLLVRSDTWLALVGGRMVWHGGLPHRDTLTVWAHGRTWVDQQWLGQLFFYAVHGIGGLRLLLIVHLLVLVTAFALALVFAMRTGASSRSAGLIGLAALVTALPNSTVRTQALAYLLFVAVMWLLAADTRRPSRRVFFALPLLVLWANVHGSVVLGAGLVVLYALLELMKSVRRPDATHLRVRAVVLGLAAPLCSLVSPYGLELAGYYHSVLGSGAFRDVVSEWRPPSFPGQLPFFVLGAVALWLAGASRKRLTLFEHLTLLLLLFAAFDALRSIVWFALAAAMVVPRALDGVWPVAPAELRRRVNLALALASIVVLLAAVGAAAARPASWFSRDYPSGAPAAVERAVTQDPSLRVFSNEAYADWLLWDVPSLAGRVAFDARFELLTGKQLHAVAHFRNRSPSDWLGAARGYRLLVLDPAAERRTISILVHRQRAQVLYRDSHVAVLLRSADAAAAA